MTDFWYNDSELQMDTNLILYIEENDSINSVNNKLFIGWSNTDNDYYVRGRRQYQDFVPYAFHCKSTNKLYDLIKFREKFEPNSFDYIIDDGSHVAAHQILTFQLLFDHLLKDSGLYFIEDLHDASFINYVSGLFKTLRPSTFLPASLQSLFNFGSLV